MKARPWLFATPAPPAGWLPEAGSGLHTTTLRACNVRPQVAPARLLDERARGRSAKLVQQAGRRRGLDWRRPYVVVLVAGHMLHYHSSRQERGGPTHHRGQPDLAVERTVDFAEQLTPANFSPRE